MKFNIKDYFVVGIVGSIATKYTQEAYETIFALLDQILPPNVKLALATGFTDIGINRIAHRWAWERGIPVIGVACDKCWEHPVWIVHHKIIVGKEWGEESERFVSILNALVQFSETPQANKEAEMALTKGIKVVNLIKNFDKLIISPIDYALEL
jgi:hypothetical protein